jgi:ABC-2 type transport system ATP-binding protein
MIELQGLHKVIGQRTVIAIEALQVEAGFIAGITGTDDSDREALFQLLIGRSRPSAGAVRVAGLDPAAQRARFSRVAGILFPDDALYARRTYLANLTLFAQLHGLPAARAREVLADVGLADHASAQPGAARSGLTRRLAFGRAILHHPQVLVLAEPFAHCDEATIGLLSGLIRRAADEGTAILIVAASAEHLGSLCDALYRLEQGNLVEIGVPPPSTPPLLPFKIPVRAEDKVMLFDPAEILFVEAEEGRVSVITAAGRYTAQFTLAEIEQRLARSGFFRAHRSYLVNLQHVKEVIPFTRNSFSLRLDDPANTTIPLSKAAAGELQALLGY